MSDRDGLGFARWLQSIDVRLIGEDVNLDYLYAQWTEEAPEPMARYVLQYRDAAGFEWEPLAAFPRPGAALVMRDEELATEPAHLPRGRHRVVDLDTGEILEWKHGEASDDD